MVIIEKLKERQERYVANNLEKIRVYNREWHKNNREWDKKYRSENKEQIKIRNLERRHRIKQKAVDYLGGKCSNCGYNKSINSLIFHHYDKNNKGFTISDGNKGRKWETIKQELDKCILLCANCHGEISW